MSTYLRLVMLLVLIGGLTLHTTGAMAVEKDSPARVAARKTVGKSPAKKTVARKKTSATSTTAGDTIAKAGNESKRSVAGPATARIAKNSRTAPPAQNAGVIKCAASKIVVKAASTATAAGAAALASSRPVSDRLDLKSGAALVLEQQTSRPLFEKNADQIMPIASLTKVMTAMVVLDSAPDMDAPITITNDDVDHLRGSSSRLPVGAILPRRTALLLALMSSENRAANALGRHYPGGMQAFVTAMNRKARAIGMLESHFEDPTGLTSHNVSTAFDLAKMVAAAHDYPLIRELTTNGESTINIDGRELIYRNTNPLVRNTTWNVGLSKTGYISEAGRCLVMQAHLAGRPVVIVLLDSVGSMTRVGDANRIKQWMEGVHGRARQPIHAAAGRSATGTTG